MGLIPFDSFAISIPRYLGSGSLDWLQQAAPGSMNKHHMIANLIYSKNNKKRQHNHDKYATCIYN